MRALSVVLALFGSAALAGCDGCGPSAPSESATRGAPTPEPWTMGAARSDDVVLPPPCQLRDDTRRTVLPRDTRIASERHTLGRLLVAEGAGPMGQHAGAWQADASGLMTLGHGLAQVAAMPWPRAGTPLVRSGDRWLVMIDDGDAVALWRNGERERLGPRATLAFDDARCEAGWCALLSTRLQSDGTPMARDAGATLWLGRDDEPAHSYQRVDLAPPNGRHARALSIAALSAERAVVALSDTLRIRFIEVGQSRVELAAAGAPHGGLAALADPAPVALTRLAPDTPAACSTADAGGIGVATANTTHQLRSATPAARGTLVSVRGGLLALWIAPERCDGPRMVVHGAVLSREGAPIAPVTTIGAADDYAVATVGDQVDLWLRRAAPSEAQTVSWVRARCALPMATSAGSDQRR